MDQAPAAAAASASEETLRVSDAITGQGDSVARHFAGLVEASMSTSDSFPSVSDDNLEHILSLSSLAPPAVRESIPLPQAETERQAVGSTEIDQEAEAGQGGGNDGSPVASSSVNHAGSKRKAGASATVAKRAKQALVHPGPEQVANAIVEVDHQSASADNGVTTRRSRAASEVSPDQCEPAQSVHRKKNGQPRRAGRSRNTTQSPGSDSSMSAADVRLLHHKLKPPNAFPDWEGVETALNEYASAAGFIFGVRNCKQLADKTTVSKMTWVCSRAGKPRSTSKKQSRSEKGPGSASTKCQCPVSVSVWRKGDGTLYISKSELRHNHTLATSTAATAHLAAMAKENEESARFEELKTCALELLRQASKSEVATRMTQLFLDQLQSDLSQFGASSGQNAVPEFSNCNTVVNRAQPLAVYTTENKIQQYEDGAVPTEDPRAPTQAATTSLSQGPSNRGVRLDTLVSADSSVDDVEHARVQLSPNSRQERQRADVSKLLRVLKVLRQGFNPPEDFLRQRLSREFVRLLSGVLSTFDESQLQHSELCEAIRKGLPFVVRILSKNIQDTRAIQLNLDALCVLRSLSSTGKAEIVVESGAVPCLLEALQSDIPKLQSQAVLCLSDIVSTSTDSRKMITTKNCPPSTVLPYLPSSSPELRSAAESLLRSLLDFPNVMERGEFGPDLIQKLVDVLPSILLQRSRDEVRKYIDMNGGGDLVLVNKAAPVSFWRVFEIQTGKPAPNNTDRVRAIREVDETLFEVKSVAIDVESLQYRFYRRRRTELRPVDDEDMDDEDKKDEDPDEKDLLSEEELEIGEYCSALRELSYQDSDVHKKLVDFGLYPPLVELLYVSNSTVVCSSVFYLLYNILGFKGSFSQVIMDSKLLEVIPSFMQSRSCELRHRALALLEKISGLSRALALAIIQSSALVTNLVETMEWGAFDYGLQAASVLSDMIQHATPEFAAQMIDQNVIKMFSKLLQCNSGYHDYVRIMHALDRLMVMNPIESRRAWKECNLLSVIDKLTSNEDIHVRKTAAKFMKKWKTNKRDREIGGSSDIDDEDSDEEASDIDDGD